MNAIILAAGQGQRLRPLTNSLPKCLVQIGRRTILDHMLDRIERSGLKDVVIVSGFEAERVRRHVNQLRPRNLRVRFVINERFAETNNLYSLWLALGKVSGATTILNGDDFFNVDILKALQRSPAEASATIDFSSPLPRDAMRIVLRGLRVCGLGKTIPDQIASGNAIGLYRFSETALELLRDEVEQWVRGGRVKDFYVAAINALASRVPIRAISTRGLTWGEVDDYQDLVAAPAKLARILVEERHAAPHAPISPPRPLWNPTFLAAHC